jgi:hypothetical protein
MTPTDTDHTLRGVVDLGEGLLEFVGRGIGAGDAVGAGLDLDCPLAAGGADELADGPAGGVLDPAADGQGGESPAASMSFWLVSEIMPASATMVTAAHAADSVCRQESFAYARRRRQTVGYEAGATPTSSSTRPLSSLLAGSMIRASARSRNTSSPPAAASSPSIRYACSGASSRCPIRDEEIGSGPPLPVRTARRCGCQHRVCLVAPSAMPTGAINVRVTRVV